MTYYSRHVSISASEIKYDFHLAFDEGGSVRLTRAEPSLAEGERSMKLSLRVPRSLWRTAQLSAKIEIADPGNPKAEIDVTAAAEAIRQTLGDGVNVTLAVDAPTE
jgi:hypothetical protein